MVIVFFLQDSFANDEIDLLCCMPSLVMDANE